MPRPRTTSFLIQGIGAPSDLERDEVLSAAMQIHVEVGVSEEALLQAEGSSLGERVGSDYDSQCSEKDSLSELSNSTEEEQAERGWRAFVRLEGYCSEPELSLR